MFRHERIFLKCVKYFWKHVSRQKIETNLKLSFKCPYVHISEWEHNNTVYFKGPLWGDIYQCFPTIYISGLLVNSTENSSSLLSFSFCLLDCLCVQAVTRGETGHCVSRGSGTFLSLIMTPVVRKVFDPLLETTIKRQSEKKKKKRFMGSCDQRLNMLFCDGHQTIQ